ncbi:MAG TPA: response regulator transcription factor [Saprospiraceae bacterium]|nr:response regulator transcription factor [Saprospiraceae bacterium]
MPAKAHLLYVEDDESLSFVTRDNLEREGYQITCSADGREALELLKREKYDLCILDVMLPEIDGFTLAKELRKTDQQTPILFLTAKSLEEDRLRGLRLGGDDYLTKPFGIEELTLKIDIFLRRRQIVPSSSPTRYTVGCYQFDYANLLLAKADKERRLTQREADLLKYLLDRPGQVLRRGDILQQVWGKNDYFLGRSLDVFISRLRKYLRDEPELTIENIHGVGFRLHIPG